MSAAIHITDIEAAINYWRVQTPSDGITLSPSVAALAYVYAHMAYAHHLTIAPQHLSTAAMQAWLNWYATTPDTPCIAICTTSQGDEHCKGCGRSFAEVQHWLSMSPVEKRAVWRRIMEQGTALRFNRYAERAM